MLKLIFFLFTCSKLSFFMKTTISRTSYSSNFEFRILFLYQTRRHIGCIRQETYQGAPRSTPLVVSFAHLVETFSTKPELEVQKVQSEVRFLYLSMGLIDFHVECLSFNGELLFIVRVIFGSKNVKWSEGWETNPETFETIVEVGS